MAETLLNLHCVPFSTGTNADVAIADSFSSRTVTVSKDFWYRHYLAPSGAAGTSSATPKEFLGYFQGLLNAAAPGFWAVALQTTGLVKITYVGGTGAASITWTSTVPRNLLGFTGTLNFAAPGASQTATYLPTHACFVAAKGDDDTDWAPEYPGFAAAMTVGGVVDVLSDGVALVRRRFRLVNIPRRWTDRTARGAAGTPAIPEDISVSRLTNPGGAVSAGIAPPWTVHQHFYAARAYLCAFTDDLPSHLNGSTTLYDVGYVAPETYQSGEQFRPAGPGLRAAVTRGDVVLTLTNREDR